MVQLSRHSALPAALGKKLHLLHRLSLLPIYAVYSRACQQSAQK